MDDSTHSSELTDKDREDLATRLSEVQGMEPDVAAGVLMGYDNDKVAAHVIAQMWGEKNAEGASKGNTILNAIESEDLDRGFKIRRMVGEVQGR